MTIAMAAVLTTAARDYVIVIDPGHGGRDSGAPGANIEEKTINLSVAKLLGSKINDRLKKVKIVYTRTDDRTLLPGERAYKANNAGGDLYIAIHTDSSDGDAAATTSGSSVLVATTKMYVDSATAVNDPAVATQVAEGRRLAKILCDKLSTMAGRRDRGVRERNDLPVLTLTRMPSVLVELDFICNPTQEAYLSSPEGQEELTEALATGVVEYVTSLKGGSATPAKKPKSGKKGTPPPSSPADKGTGQGRPNSGDTATTAPPAGTTIYKVQFLTSPRQLPAGAPELKGLTDVDFYLDGKTYKYTVGATPSISEAQKIATTVREQFPDAFIITTVDGKRIK